MKTWLKAFWRFLIEPWASALALLVMAIIMGQLLRFMFYLGGRAEERETAVWRGLAIEAEPEQCALCTDKIWIRGTYPCLVKLGTGEVQEIWVYNREYPALSGHGRCGIRDPRLHRGGIRADRHGDGKS